MYGRAGLRGAPPWSRYSLAAGAELPDAVGRNRATRACDYLLSKLRHAAKVAELADAPDLGSGSRKALGVRLPPFALSPEST